MTSQLPATISNDLINQTNLLLQSTGHYLDESNLDIRRLLAAAKKLMAVDAFESHIAHAIIYQICGNVDKVKDHLRIAEKLGNPLRTKEIATVTNINLGFFSEAQRSYKQYGRPQSGNFLESINAGYASLSFQQICEFLDEAKKMNIDLNNVDLETAQKVNNVLQSAGVSQKDLSAMIDIVGEILRENKLFYLNNLPDIFVEADTMGSPCVFITFFIKESYENAAKLYETFIDRLILRFGHIPEALHVSIQSMQ
jgi:hypothetical protein